MHNVLSARPGTLNLPGPPPGSDAAAAALMETLQIKSRHCLWPGEQSWVAVSGQQGQRGSHVLQGWVQLAQSKLQQFRFYYCHRKSREKL